MEDVRIILSALWVALMLTYFLGDVLRIFSGDFVPGEMAGEKATQRSWFIAALVMLIPIVMVVFTLVLPNPVIGWITIICAIFLLLFNLAGLRSYPSHYDRFLIIVGLIFNIVTVWYAWCWVIGLF
ncbi:MAG: DUF6326 family protein [Promethearchaeota archaeon]